MCFLQPKKKATNKVLKMWNNNTPNSKPKSDSTTTKTQIFHEFKFTGKSSKEAFAELL